MRPGRVRDRGADPLTDARRGCQPAGCAAAAEGGGKCGRWATHRRSPRDPAQLGVRRTDLDPLGQVYACQVPGRLFPRAIAPVVVILLLVSGLGAVDANTNYCNDPPAQTAQSYALQTLPGTASNGIDGYVRGSTSNMDDPWNEHILEWVQIANSADPVVGEWVQIGQFQGCLGHCPNTPCDYGPTSIHLYAENQCGPSGSQSYSLTDLSTPPAANYPVYVFYDGNQGSSGHCAGNAWYEFKFEKGTFCQFCAPSAFGYLRSSIGYDQSALEVNYKSGQSPPTVAATYFGTDNNHQADASYGLHTYIQSNNSWLLWSAANFPTTTCFQAAGGVHNTIRQFDAWYADLSGSSGSC